MIRVAAHVGMAILVGFYVLIFGEAFLRVMDPQPMMPRYVVPTPWGIRGNEPNITYRHWTPEAESTLTINSWGMRDTREFPLEPPPGTCRVALMGDSYFMGYESDVEDSIAGFLEAEFEAAGYDLDVLNFAVSGHGTSEMVLHFQNLASRFSPDVTVFQFHGSDYTDNVRANLHRLDLEGNAVATGQTYLPAVGIRNRLEAVPGFRWVSEHSQIYSGVRDRAGVFVKVQLARLRAQKNSGAAEDGKDDPASEASTRPLTAALIKMAMRLTEAAGSDWYMFDIPARQSRTEFVSLLELDHLPSEVLDHVVSPLPAFERHADPGTKIYFEKGRLHLTPLGNRLAAEALFERISSDSAVRLAKCRGQHRAAASRPADPARRPNRPERAYLDVFENLRRTDQSEPPRFHRRRFSWSQAAMLRPFAVSRKSLSASAGGMWPMGPRRRR